MRRHIMRMAVVIGIVICAGLNAAEERVRARHILFPENEKAKAEGVLQQLKEGSITFEKALEEYSIDTYTKKSGGDLGFFSRRTNLAKPVKDAAFQTKKGEYFKTPVHSKFGWHILQVTDRKGESAPPVTIKNQNNKPKTSQKVSEPAKLTIAMKLVDEQYGRIIDLDNLELELNLTNIGAKPIDVLRPELWPLGVKFVSNILTKKVPVIKDSYIKSINNPGTVQLLPGQGMSQKVKLVDVWNNLDEETWWNINCSGSGITGTMEEKYPEKVKELKKDATYAETKSLMDSLEANKIGFDTHKVTPSLQYYVVFTLKKGDEFLVKLNSKQNISEVLYFIKLVRQDFYKGKIFNKRQVGDFLSGGGLGRDGSGWTEQGKFVSETDLDNNDIKAKDFILVTRRKNYSYECGSMFMIALKDLPDYKKSRLGITIGTVSGDWNTIEKLSSDSGWSRRRQNPIAYARLFTEEQLPTIWKSDIAASVTKAPVVSDKPLPKVEIQTEKGTITVELYEDDAPNTVANFISLVEKGFYNGIVFHRVVPGFVVQGGDPKGTGTGGPGYTIKDEVNGRTHVQGAVGMAKTRAPNSAGSQFYICLKAAHFLDKGYTVFGKVIKGMDVVEKIKKGDKMVKLKVLQKRDHPYVPEKL